MTGSKVLNIVLWVLQVLLALFFAVASGAPKLLMSAEALHAMGAMPIPLAEPFLKFIGICEVAGALGLVVPGLIRNRTWLTPLAAACLTTLTVCATVYQLIASKPGNAVFAICMGAVCAFVAYGRWRLAPHSAGASRTPELAAAI